MTVSSLPLTVIATGFPNSAFENVIGDESEDALPQPPKQTVAGGFDRARFAEFLTGKPVLQDQDKGQGIKLFGDEFTSETKQETKQETKEE